MSDLFFNSLYVIFSVIVSLTFWVYDSNKGWYRFIASIHSIMLLLTLIVALHFGLGLKMYNTLILTFTFYTMLLLSLISIVINVVIFKDQNGFICYMCGVPLHLLQLFLLELCLLQMIGFELTPQNL